MAGKVQYIGQDKQIRCNRCNRGPLAWVQSTKTGKWYLANCVVSQSEEKAMHGICFIEPWNPHKCER